MSDLNTILSGEDSSYEIGSELGSELGSEIDSDIEQGNSLYTPTCIICLVDDNKLMNANAPFTSDNKHYVKQCRCNVLVHEECIIKWYNTSKKCLICHNKILIKRLNNNNGIVNEYSPLNDHGGNTNIYVYNRQGCVRFKWQCIILLIFCLAITYFYYIEYRY